MKTVKVRRILLGLSAIALISTILMSCEQNVIEDLTPTTEEQLHQIEDRVPLIVGTWWNSSEEETNATLQKIYRRDDYNFPIQQTRTGFTFDNSGDFVYYYINNLGQLEEKHGVWRFMDSETISIRFDFSFNTPVSEIFRRIKTISTTSDILVVKPLINW